MKKSIFLFLYLIVFTSYSYAQEFRTVIKSNQEYLVLINKDYKNILINDKISLNEIFYPNNWKELIKIFGEPKDFIEDNNKVKPYKILKFEGAEFNYQYSNGEFVFRRAVLSSNFFLKIGEFKIYPGMTSENLDELIPRAFKNQNSMNRIDIATSVTNEKGKTVYNKEGEIVISENNFLSIYLNPSSGEIETINIIRNTH